MASYGSNILPHEAAYYTLTNATISDGVLTLMPGGTAVHTFSNNDIASLTEWFLVNMLAATDNYTPSLYVTLEAITVGGTKYSYTCTPTSLAGEMYRAELHMEAAEYIQFSFTVYSAEQVSIALWEVCPEVTGTDMTTIIDGVEQSLPRLLYDYNTSPLSIGRYEETIALITCNLKQATDIQGHLLIAYNASHACTITLRFKDNDATELFAPVFYDVHAGRGTLGIPHAYLDRISGFHNFLVSAHCSTGTISISTRGLLFTIDGGYLAERLIDVGADVRDITIENKSTDYQPSFIWVIGVEAGELLVRRRAYSTRTSGVAFEPMYSLGPAVDGAIEFDGEWVLAPNSASELYRLNTFDNPYCFIIDNDNNLYVQRGGDSATRTLLDTNVRSVSACRGYKSMYYPAQDQGLIVAYTKYTDYAYYTQYAYDEYTGRYMWSSPIELDIFDGGVSHIQVHRLNDYRVGFAITTALHNYWWISSRTYVGQSYKPEIVGMYPKSYVTVGLLDASDLPNLSAECVLSDDRLTITATFSYPIRCVAYNPADYIYMPQALIDIVDTIEIHENVLTITVEEAITAPYTILLDAEFAWQYQFNDNWLAMPGDVTLTYDPYGHLSYTSTNDATASFVVSQFTPTVSLRGLEIIQHTYDYDAVSVDPTLTADIDQIAINFKPHTYDYDTVRMIPTTTSTVQLILVGTEPI